MSKTPNAIRVPWTERQENRLRELADGHPETRDFELVDLVTAAVPPGIQKPTTEEKKIAGRYLDLLALRTGFEPKRLRQVARENALWSQVPTSCPSVAAATTAAADSVCARTPPDTKERIYEQVG